MSKHRIEMPCTNKIQERRTGVRIRYHGTRLDHHAELGLNSRGRAVFYQYAADGCVRQDAGANGVEACYTSALERATAMELKSLELRAAMSLSRLWKTKRKKRKAYELLSGIYGWFTEGFETQDLKDAKALMDELS